MICKITEISVAQAIHLLNQAEEPLRSVCVHLYEPTFTLGKVSIPMSYLPGIGALCVCGAGGWGGGMRGGGRRV